MSKMEKTVLSSDPRVRIFRLKGAGGGPRLLITAGIHGGEHTPIQVAFELLEYFSRIKNLRGSVTIVPIVNLDGYAEQLRENPTDGKNINAAGTLDGVKPQPYTPSDAIADEIIALAGDHDYFLDLHSANKGRYLSHVYYHDGKNSRRRELARVFGFYFVVYHNVTKTKNDVGVKPQKNIPISTRVAQTDTTALTLELGAGVMVRRKDVRMALAGIVSFCRYIGMLEGPPLVKKTPRSRVFARERNKITTVVKAPQAGNICFRKSLGEVVKKGEAVAFLVNLQGRVLEIKSPVEGRLVLRRITSRIEPEEVDKETIFRVMPKKA